MNRLITPLLALESCLQAEPAEPNVIILLTDDQGYGDLPCYGNPHSETPNLDRLYGESVRFTDFHTSAIRTPTRSQLMTGIDDSRYRIERGFPPGEQRNFLDCVKSRKPTTYPALDLHHMSTTLHMGVLAIQLGRKLRRDTKSESFLNDDEANRMRRRPAPRNWEAES